MSHTSVSNLLKIINNAETRVNVGKRYYHYKSPEKEYKVIRVALMENNEKPAVIYTDGTLTWIRDLDVWCEKVDHNGELVSRFTESECVHVSCGCKH